MNKEIGDPICRGEDSAELRKTKTGVEYLKLDWNCRWSGNIDEAVGESQMRTLLFFKHKYAETFVVLVTWLTLEVNRQGKLITLSRRKKYRVNLNTRKVTVAYHSHAVPIRSFLAFGDHGKPWMKSRLEQELLTMTNYAKMIWDGMGSRKITKV
jgi:hypothetical protein